MQGKQTQMRLFFLCGFGQILLFAHASVSLPMQWNELYHLLSPAPLPHKRPYMGLC